jgi:hypothetical protein
MTRQTRPTAQWDWGEQLIRPLEKIVERVAAYDPDDDTSDFEEMLLEPLSISGGESFTAEDHRGREILELLQNAQDAAGGLYDAESDPAIGTRGVYIGISDDGLVVANTGDTFDFSDPERRKSLRILGHSETSEETIGQFGVGLTSIRSMGEAYEVWTKAPRQVGTLEPQDCWRVFCGPRTTLAAIASAVPDARGIGSGDKAYDRFCETAIGGSEVLHTSIVTNQLESVPLSADQIPYFTYPVAMQSWDQVLETPTNGAADRPLRDRATDLLTYGEKNGSDLESCPSEIRSLLSDVGPFTTAVFVDFEDEDWRALFEAITGTQPSSPDQDPAERLEDQAWFDNSDTDRVTPELLLNLGHIDRLVVERFGDSIDDPSSLQSWEVFGRQRVEEADAPDLPIAGQEIRHGSGTEEVAVREVAVQLETVSTHNHLETPANTDISTYTFWDAEFTDRQKYDDYDWYDHPDIEEETSDDAGGVDTENAQIAKQDIEISVLLQTVTSDGDSELYSPHLYYPISGAENQFPYCIHGDFVVQQNRQSLAGSGLERNCVVAAEAARLIGHLSETLATAEELPEIERAAIPWRLLPKPLEDNEEYTNWPVAEEVAAKSMGEVADNEPLRVLRAAIYRRLRHHNNIQVVSEDTPQASLIATADTTQNVLLHYDRSVLAGISALYPLVNYTDSELDPARVLQRADSAVVMSLPTETTLDALLRWLVDGQVRPEAIDSSTTADNPDNHQDSLSTDLLGHLQSGVSTNRDSRLEQLVSRDDPDTNLKTQLITPWWSVLQTWGEIINTQTDVGCAISEVPPETGRAVLEATVTLGEEDDTFPDETEFTPATEGPYLLPCDPFIQNQESDLSVSERTESHVQLVRVESHETRGEHQRQILRPQNETNDEIVPPEDTGFALYLLSRTTSPKSQQVIKDANWGTREYAGAADLYRTLLRDVRDESAGISIADLSFLITVYNAIDFDSQTIALDAVEGGYHPQEQIKKLASSTTAVDNLKPRVNARQISIPATLLDGEEPKPGYTIRFGGEFIRDWLSNHFETEDEGATPLEDLTEADGDQLTQPPIQTEGPVATLPSTDELDGLTEHSSAEIATQLGMLGVSVLPDVRTLFLRGDDTHPDRQTVSSWNPTTWTAESDGRLSELTDVLDSTIGQTYLDLLVTPPFGPGESSDHTPNCDVKHYPQSGDDTLTHELANYDVMLTSWLWLSPERTAEITASELANLLELYGDALADSVLQTGWSCDYGKGNTQNIANFVPSLLNWQLRAVTDWDEVEWFYSPTIDGLWTDHDEWGLQYAVLEEDIDNRSTAASAFPRIDPAASPVPESVWRTLGVKTLGELNATEAAFRLNALIDAASAPAADSDTAVGEGYVEHANPAIELPGIAAIDAWQTLYGTLLGTIGAEVNDRSDEMTLGKLQFLDRVPAQTSDGTWVGLSCDTLDTAVYYDSTESDWENRLAQLEADTDEIDTTDADEKADVESRPNRYLLPRPPSRYISEDEFEALWEATEATQQPSQYPEIDRSKTTDADGDRLQNALEDPEIKYGVLAAAPGNEAQTDHRNQYETITETLRRIDHSKTDSSDRETAWRVTPVDSETGLDLDNVTAASNYTVAYDDRVVDDPTEPISLADLFMALYGGGNKDSYKLALLGRDVEGKDTVREELRATDVQELETDLRLAAILFDSTITIERGMLTLPDGIAVPDLREKIARCLEEGTPFAQETERVMDESVATAIDGMCTTESTTFRIWAGKLIRTSNTRIDILKSILGIDTPHESPSKQQLTALQRLEETLPAYRSTNRLPAFNELLPNGHPRRVAEILHELVTGIQQTTHRQISNPRELTDLQAHGASLAWADRIFPSEESGELIGFESSVEPLTTRLHNDSTWFHLAWWLAIAEEPPLETPSAEALVEAIAEYLGGSPDEFRNKILEMTRQDYSNISGRQTGSSSSSDGYTETDNTTLFNQMASDTDWKTRGDGLDSDFSASISSLDVDGSSGGGESGDGPINQTGDQPRVAELDVLQRSYEALYETDLPLETIQAQLAAMRRDSHNYWRPVDGWTDYDRFAVDALPTPDELGQSGTEFPMRAFDITDEGDAGYDILDLTGWAIRQASDVSATSEGVELTPYQDPDTLTPVPVEVKSVDPDRPSFKFSLNQYQRAYQFVTPVGEYGSLPYVLCLVDVSLSETADAPRYRVDPYDTIIITCPSDLRQLLPSDLSPNDNETLIDTLILETIYGGDLMISE